MKTISRMEIQMILDTLATAEEELNGAEDDGWCVTTDVHDLLDGSRRIMYAILNGPDIDLEK